MELDYYNKIYNIMKIEMMSNAELKIHMKEMEYEYEALKIKLKECIDRMSELDKNYSQMSETLQKRTKGII